MKNKNEYNKIKQRAKKTVETKTKNTQKNITKPLKKN